MLLADAEFPLDAKQAALVIVDVFAQARNVECVDAREKMRLDVADHLLCPEDLFVRIGEAFLDHLCELFERDLCHGSVILSVTTGAEESIASLWIRTPCEELLGSTSTEAARSLHERLPRQIPCRGYARGVGAEP